MRLIENGNAVEVQVSPSDLSELEKLNSIWKQRLGLRNLPIIISNRKASFVTLQARNVAGFVRIGELQLEILPKFIADLTEKAGWQTVLWNFLAYGNGLTLSETSAGQASKNLEIPELMADLFLTSLEKASVMGYPIGYRKDKFVSGFLKGRLDPRSYGKLIPVSGRLSNIASRLSPNVLETQLLVWASNKLSTLVREPRLKQALARWRTSVPGVDSVLPTHKIVGSERRYPHLKEALSIAHLLATEKGIIYGRGQMELPGFLWNSDTLFEDVCFRLFQDSARSLGVESEKPRIILATGKNHTGSIIKAHTIPDIMLRRKGQRLISLDAKYKTLASTPSTSDIYQALSVGRVASLKEVGIVYPAEGRNIKARILQPHGAGMPELVHIVEIGLEAFESKSEINRLQQSITEWLSGTAALTEPQKVDLISS
jgi:5-methylcytosine-specific restriction endonuclease McrBC regulatory subunit McrC